MSEVFKDRRYQRTHEAIILNTIKLAKISGWKKVTVTKICHNANLNRNSFYLHFETINDVFDEIENVFINKYHSFMNSSPIIEVMIKTPEYYDLFHKFLLEEAKYVNDIKDIGRSEQLLSKIKNVYMEVFEKDLKSSAKYKHNINIILPYITGCTLIFFTNWVNDPLHYDIKNNVIFSGEFIDKILNMS